MPTRSALDAIILWKQRYAMGELIIRLMESFRDDYMPRVKTSEAFELLVIIERLFDLHEVSRLGTASAISRSTDIPRSTVHRRLDYLKKLGAVERRGSGFLLVPAFLNHPIMLEGFKRRVCMVVRAPKKLKAA